MPSRIPKATIHLPALSSIGWHGGNLHFPGMPWCDTLSGEAEKCRKVFQKRNGRKKKVKSE